MASQPSANPAYKLTYFDLRALAEPIRLLFAYGGINYEDVRIADDKWPEVKPTMPMGQMPILEIDGQVVHQSVAIGRYVAKKVGLAGANDWEQLLIDVAVDTVSDLRSKMSTAFWDEDEAVKTKKLAELKKDTIPFYLGKLDAIVQENNGYFVLGKLTYADIFFVGVLDYMNYMAGFDLTEKHANLKKVVDNVSGVESIKAWLEKRPKNEF